LLNMPDLYQMALMVPAIVLGLTCHEFAHGWVADRLGDHTARYQGRLTLNPVAHVDVIGLIMLFIAGFGWAKPVPVNPYNLRGDRNQGMLLVSLAGPATNMLIAVLGAFVLGLGAWKLSLGEDIFRYIIYINIVLAIFNLLPIPPLDGSKILAGLWPGSQQWLAYIENYGFIILLLLLLTGIIGRMLGLILVPIYNLLLQLAFRVSSIGF